MSPMFGAVCFGAVIGWITYRTLRRSSEQTKLGDISAVIGAVGGGAVIAIFNDQDQFSGYSIGLAAGFFAYFLVGLFIAGKSEVNGWMGKD
ncbi:hypothetical protein NA78x_002791 [Anatilimnocola sp. NA78]|uniref:hypothetical protein n=1 Tax=Anatilimnocola sp. NA78 TaxID=3415683 RepID=UPI003CE490F3